MLNKDSILNHLPQNLKNQLDIHVFESVTSTSDIAKELALPNDKTSALVVSNHQTKGRGRLNRQFISPPAAGLYMSLLLPALPLDRLLLATPAAAVAAAEAVSKATGIQLQIKWVNDLYIDKKKVGGILTEAVTDYKTGRISHLVIGIGINCQDAGIPSDERNIIGSLDAPEIDKNLLAANIVQELDLVFQQIKIGDISFMDKYRHHSNLIGKTVTVYKTHLSQEDAIDATAIDIDNNGNLVVMFQDGAIAHLSSGEVSIRSK